MYIFRICAYRKCERQHETDVTKLKTAATKFESRARIVESNNLAQTSEVVRLAEARTKELQYQAEIDRIKFLEKQMEHLCFEKCNSDEDRERYMEYFLRLSRPEKKPSKMPRGAFSYAPGQNVF